MELKAHKDFCTWDTFALAIWSYSGAAFGKTSLSFSGTVSGVSCWALISDTCMIPHFGSNRKVRKIFLGAYHTIHWPQLCTFSCMLNWLEQHLQIPLAPGVSSNGMLPPTDLGAAKDFSSMHTCLVPDLASSCWLAGWKGRDSAVSWNMPSCAGNFLHGFSTSTNAMACLDEPITHGCPLTGLISVSCVANSNNGAWLKCLWIFQSTLVDQGCRNPVIHRQLYH